jgi:ankyrin repeat protein
MSNPIILSKPSLRAYFAVFVVAILTGCGHKQPANAMRETRDEVSKEVAEFHRIVESGSLDELRQVLERGADVNAPGQIGKTALMVAIDVKSIHKMRLLIEHGVDPELTDRFNATALRHAVSGDYADGVQYLLSLGVDRGHHPKYPLKQVDYGVGLPEIELPDEMREVLSEDEWKASVEEMQQSVLDLGRIPTVEPIVADVQSVEVLKLFLQAGDDLNLAPCEVKREYIGLSNVGLFQCPIADFRKYKSPSYGISNPQRIDNPFWRDMVKLGCNTYVARQHFSEPSPFTKPGVVWCYDRFGSSLTPLPDGRFVQIGGEHEDYYDPDFYIYNDVVIHDGKGEVQIYGYPKEVFPPTDFHSATLVGEWMYIIGCLGYADQRQVGQTPVYRVKVESWEIERVQTSGEMPSWIHDHRSTYEPKRNVIRVDNGKIFVAGKDDDLEVILSDESFELDLSSFEWRKVN